MLSSVIAAGTNASGAVSINQSTTLLKIALHSGSSAVVNLNGQSVFIPNKSGYEDFPGDYPSFTVTSGNIDWVAFG